MKEQTSTLHYLRHYKAGHKYHAQENQRKVQPLPATKAELNFLHSKHVPQAASTPGGRHQVQQQSCLQYQENNRSDSHVSPFNVLHARTNSYRLEQCSDFIQTFVL